MYPVIARGLNTMRCAPAAARLRLVMIALTRRVVPLDGCSGNRQEPDRVAAADASVVLAEYVQRNEAEFIRSTA